MNEEGAFDMAACLEAVRRGDEDAARSFMQQLHPLVLKLVRAHRPSRMSEEDLVQTVFMKVFVNLRQFSGRVPIEHWVSRIAVNTCYNALKAEKVRPETAFTDLPEQEKQILDSLSLNDADLHPSQRLAAKELLDKLMARLSAPDRLLIQLLHLEERSVAEITKITGWSVPSVKVRAFRARLKMKGFLKETLREEKI